MNLYLVRKIVMHNLSTLIKDMVGFWFKSCTYCWNHQRILFIVLRFKLFILLSFLLCSYRKHDNLPDTMGHSALMDYAC